MRKGHILIDVAFYFLRSGSLQIKVFSQCATAVLFAEQTPFLQNRHDMLYKVADAIG